MFLATHSTVGERGIAPLGGMRTATLTTPRPMSESTAPHNTRQTGKRQHFSSVNPGSDSDSRVFFKARGIQVKVHHIVPLTLLKDNCFTCCVSVCCTIKGISYIHTYIPSVLDLPPTIPHHPITPLGHPRALS